MVIACNCMYCYQSQCNTIIPWCQCGFSLLDRSVKNKDPQKETPNSFSRNPPKRLRCHHFYICMCQDRKGVACFLVCYCIKPDSNTLTHRALSHHSHITLTPLSHPHRCWKIKQPPRWWLKPRSSCPLWRSAAASPLCKVTHLFLFLSVLNCVIQYVGMLPLTIWNLCILI